jgi:tRNA-2-methylthio-N6-dimethylallyladenosine synthase
VTGRTRTNKIVNYCGDKKDIGQLVNIKISRAQQHSLYGEKVQGSQDSRVQGN